MINSSRTSPVSKVTFIICVLMVMAAICLVTHQLITNNHHTVLLLRHHITNRHNHQSQDTKVTPSGLMDLIVNVTHTVLAMEAQAKQLDAELQRMRQKTRQLLWKRRKDALWTAIHKCVFFYGCSKGNFTPRKMENGANKTYAQSRNGAGGGAGAGGGGGRVARR
jgi:hypothetical protein